MFALRNSVQNVFKKGGLDIQNVVWFPRKLFGFAAKIVCPPKICVDFQRKILNNLIEKDFLEMGVCFLSVLIVAEKFQDVTSQISKIIYPSVKKSFGIEQKWTKMVEICNTPEFYFDAVNETFLDQEYTFGRMYVLTLFTENVCTKHPEISIQIKKIYMDFIRQIK